VRSGLDVFSSPNFARPGKKCPFRAKAESPLSGAGPLGSHAERYMGGTASVPSD
jgi:hypothetical protein